MKKTEDDAALREVLWENGYESVHRLTDGRYVAVRRMLYTCGLFVGLNRHGYARRYCYEHCVDALVAIETWDGVGDPPGPWIKVKGEGGERLGPGAVDADVS